MRKTFDEQVMHYVDNNISCMVVQMRIKSFPDMSLEEQEDCYEDIEQSMPPFSTPRERIIGLKHGISEFAMGQCYQWFRGISIVVVRYEL